VNNCKTRCQRKIDLNQLNKPTKLSNTNIVLTMEIKLTIKISGGAGKATVCIPERDDMDIEQSGEYTIDLSAGRHDLSVYGRPPADGSLEVTFKQGENKLGSHTYQAARSIFFTLNVA
jgi:hypothetical protein